MINMAHLAHRTTFIEKTIKVKVNQENWCPGVWYFDRCYESMVFDVRNSTKVDYGEMINSPNYGKQFKDRCVDGFYVVVGEKQNADCLIGKKDCVIV